MRVDDPPVFLALGWGNRGPCSTTAREKTGRGKEWEKRDLHGGRQRHGKLVTSHISGVMYSQPAWTKPRDTPGWWFCACEAGMDIFPRSPKGPSPRTHDGNSITYLWVATFPSLCHLPASFLMPSGIPSQINDLHSHPYLTMSFWENTNEDSTTESGIMSRRWDKKSQESLCDHP